MLSYKHNVILLNHWLYLTELTENIGYNFDLCGHYQIWAWAKNSAHAILMILWLDIRVG
jgi:hypothetical protein